MSQEPRKSGFLAELRRRHVVRTALAYAAVVFVVLQLGEIILPAFQSPFEADASMRILVVGAVLLLPVVLVVAWVYEITPLGIRSMEEIDSEAGIEPHGNLSHRAALMAVTIVAVVGAGLWWRSTDELVPAPGQFRTASLFQGAETTDANGPISSLAVLPLDDPAGEADQDYFAPAMHEALLSELSGIDFMRVISRTSVMQYSVRGRSMSQVGRDLNVDAVVEGSVFRADGQVRITVTLVHAASDTELWGETYVRELDDLIALQREVAQTATREIEALLRDRAGKRDPTRLAVADPSSADGTGERADSTGGPAVGGDGSGSTGAPAVPEPAQATRTAQTEDVIEARDTGAERPADTRTGTSTAPGDGAPSVTASPDLRALPDVRTFTPEAEEAFMRGRVALFKSAPGEGGADAEQFFRQVLSVDSLYVPALAGLAGALVTGDGDTTRVIERIEAARDVASRAVRLDPSNPEAQEVLRSTEDALKVLEGGEATIAVHLPTTHLGQLVQEQVARIEIRDAPRDPDRGVRSFIRLAGTGRLPEAADLGDRLLEEGVDDLVLWEGMEQLRRIADDVDGLVEVRVARREVRGREPGASLRSLVGALQEEGAAGYWRWKIDESRERQDQGLPVQRSALATAYLAVGQQDAALEVLAAAVEAREPTLAFLRFDPVWDAVRAEPRFQALVKEFRGGPSREARTGPGN